MVLLRLFRRGPVSVGRPCGRRSATGRLLGQDPRVRWAAYNEAKRGMQGKRRHESTPCGCTRTDPELGPKPDFQGADGVRAVARSRSTVARKACSVATTWA